MEQTRASVTALGAALMRAVHTRVAPSPLIDDPWGDRLVLETEREVIRNVVLNGLSPQARERCERLGTPSTALDAALQEHPGYGWAVLRTRYAEDALEVAVRRGVRQYVIVGAGFDSFALRQLGFAGEVDVFEIDHPATQELKRQRLREYDVPLPGTLHFVPADLSQEQIRTL
jgi:methyltransferase (TIGR00027 family)